MRRLLIVDLEATCWERPQHDPEHMETIEIGALLVDPAAADAPSAFQVFVRPVRSPVLSAFCTDLTGIRQCDVDAAETLPVGEVSGEARRLLEVTRESLGIGLDKARCGNRVSDAAQEPTSPVEPSVEELDSPVATAGREVAPEAGELDPLRAYELFASVGAMPPAMSAEGLPAAIPGVPPAIEAGPVVVGGWLGGIPGAPGGPPARCQYYYSMDFLDFNP